MKKLLLFLALVTGFTAVNAQTKLPYKETKETPKPIKKEAAAIQAATADATIDFESKVVDYGVIEYNADGVRKFVFANNGTEPLIIKSAKVAISLIILVFISLSYLIIKINNHVSFIFFLKNSFFQSHID